MRHRYFTTSLTVDVYSESVCLWSLMNNVFNLFTVHTTVYHTSTKNSVRDPNLKCTMTESKLILLCLSYHSTEKYNSPQTHISPFKQHTSKREVPLNFFSNSKMYHHHFISLPHTRSSFFPFHQTFFHSTKLQNKTVKYLLHHHSLTYIQLVFSGGGGQLLYYQLSKHFNSTTSVLFMMMTYCCL